MLDINVLKYSVVRATNRFHENGTKRDVLVINRTSFIQRRIRKEASYKEITFRPMRGTARFGWKVGS